MERERFDIAGFLTGVVVGAGLMFVLDPVKGRRRRAYFQSKRRRALRETSEGLQAVSQDIGNRLQGAAAEMRTGAESVPDEVLVQRVRAEMGRVVSHPRSIQVWAHNGTVEVSGQILEGEVKELLSRIHGVREVKSVENRLDVFSSPESIPGLQ